MGYYEFYFKFIIKNNSVLETKIINKDFSYVLITIPFNRRDLLFLIKNVVLHVHLYYLYQCYNFQRVVYVKFVYILVRAYFIKNYFNRLNYCDTETKNFPPRILIR